MVGRIGRHLCGGWSVEQKADWTQGCVDELAEAPFMLVEKSLSTAGRSVGFPNQLVSWIFEDIDREWTALKREQKIVERLAAL